MSGGDTVTLIKTNVDSEVVEKIKKRIQSEPDLSHINILIEIMESMEEISTEEGTNKKEKAIAIYDTVLKDLDMYVDDDKLVDKTIDIVVDLTKGKYNINKIKKVGLSCLPNLFQCVSGLLQKRKN